MADDKHRGLPQRKKIRLHGYDYAQAGYYFVTICTKDKKKLLCKIIGNDAPIVPSAIGEKVIKCWENISVLYNNVKTDYFCLMPNHIHGIIIIDRADVGNDAPVVPRRLSLPDIIRDFKSVTTRYYSKMVDPSLKNTLWQHSYYDHIIRSDDELQKIRQYIIDNPAKWQEDKYFI